MNQQEKLQVLLPHWIEHNQGHAQECRKWTEQVSQGEVQSNLNAALQAMEQVTKYLSKALDAAGGPATKEGHHHHHHHE